MYIFVTPVPSTLITYFAILIGSTDDKSIAQLAPKKQLGLITILSRNRARNQVCSGAMENIANLLQSANRREKLA